MPSISTAAVSNSSSPWDLGSSQTNNATRTTASSYQQQVADAARGFETTLVRQMLSEMRNSPFNPKETGSNDGYTQMVDDQMAATITKGKGLGFAQKMTEQLMKQSAIAKQISAQN
jgi:Rod binding domain-containing protein